MYSPLPTYEKIQLPLHPETEDKDEEKETGRTEEDDRNE
jgi:hypothetical protein